MGFEKYDDEKLVKTTKGLKTVLIALGIIWIALLAFYVGTLLYSVEKGNFQFATAVPFIVGPVTLLPVFLNYKNFKKEIERRGLK
ncbi:hypothetical protein [Croceivirga thetidis]|uniref:Redox-active disulfide protein 2 n=1 Tax=Croceivirga thetidis TaxID=2721623 RepID=A0ABX1GUU2_9FLAO|nr:hypothetical protein [Croceivirga thetidis]NKI32685.1 hypothetical protein [Croceivirga thetidis]